MHNIRIERLWYDLTHGIGSKWKNFFVDLELYWGLDTDNDEHIWLLHYLSMDSLNEELTEWGETWNYHKLRIRDERQRSPTDMFMFGVMTKGLYAPYQHFNSQLDTVQEEELPEYGVDWDDWDLYALREHHVEQNELNQVSAEEDRADDRHRQISIPEAAFMLDTSQIEALEHRLSQIGQWRSNRSMALRREVWVGAIDFCCHGLGLSI